MKQIKNATLAIIGGLVVLSVATISCSKSSGGGTPAPHITSANVSTIAAGGTLTLTGTGFVSPATFSIGGVTGQTVTVVSSTSATVVVPAGAHQGLDTLVVTTVNGTGSYAVTVTAPLPTSNSVAAANLIAHWTFDNTQAEVGSGVTPTVGGGGSVSYTTGLIGGANGALAFNGANLLYGVIPALNNANALSGGFTLSMWAQIPTTPLFTSLWQLNGNIGDIFGLVGLAFRENANDTLDFDGGMVTATNAGTVSSGFNFNAQGVASGFKVPPATWSFITMVYDTTAKTLSYYGNGHFKASFSTTSVVTPGSVFTLLTTSSPATAGCTATNQVTFGSLDINPPLTGSNQTLATWQGGGLLQGTVIDDTRLFNTSLSLVQIDSLYNLGSQGL